MTNRFVFGGTRAVAGAVALMFISVTALPAAAQDVQNLMNRLNRMERDMQDLQRQLYRGSGTGITATPVSPAPVTNGNTSSSAEAGNQSAGFDTSYAARVEVRLQQLETLIRSLTGKIEEVGFKAEQNANRIDRLVRDVDFRLQALERGGIPAQSDAGQSSTGQGADTNNTTATASAGAESPTAGQGQGQGVLGYLKQSEVNDLEKQDFDSAEEALSLFLERHPKHPLAGNAVYWLGETYYVRKDFANAAKTFATGYTEYPGSSKTADNLLKLGFSLARMDRKEDACVTFDQLNTDFPNASSNIKRRAMTERQRIGC